MGSSKDRELEQRLQGFEEVWRRVAGEKQKECKAEPKLMPRRRSKPRGRYESQP